MKLIELMTNYIHNKKYDEYCELCENNRLEAIECYKSINPDYYQNTILNLHNPNSPYNTYIKKAEDLKNQGNSKDELELLEAAISNNIDTPGAYKRASVIYSKDKKYLEAITVIEKWFENGNWTIPNCTNMTKKLLLRMKMLKDKMV